MRYVGGKPPFGRFVECFSACALGAPRPLPLRRDLAERPRCPACRACRACRACASHLLLDPQAPVLRLRRQASAPDANQRQGDDPPNRGLCHRTELLGVPVDTYTSATDDHHDS